MQPQIISSPSILPSLPKLNIQPPPLANHSYILYHQKRHLMLINGQPQFNSQTQELSSKHKPKQSDYKQMSDKQYKTPYYMKEKLINITQLMKCQRCHNWIHKDQFKQHMTFHGAIILDNLFLGDKFSSQSRKQLIQRLQITHVINAASELPNIFQEDGIQYYNIDLFDNLYQNVIQPCLLAAQFIQTVFQQGGKVFVHCAMGKSRSVAVILVYLMKYKRMSLKNSIDLVKEKRHIIKPNSNYMKQLEKLEHLLKQQEKEKQAN